jgi:uncharacterized membrane protein (UPF0127 family)
LITGKLIAASDGRILLSKAYKTTTLLDRLRGMLGRPEPTVDQAMVITPCNSVHMLFMRYALDIIFLDAEGTVLSLRSPLLPWKMAADMRAKQVVELRSGMVTALAITSGMQLLWQD